MRARYHSTPIRGLPARRLPSDPAGGAQSPPDAPRHHRGQTRVGAQRCRDPDLQAPVSRPSERRGRRQIAPHMPSPIEEVRDQKDSRSAAGYASFDPGRNTGTGGLEEADLDDSSPEPGLEIAGQAPQEEIGRAHAAAVTDQEKGGPCRALSLQRASP